MWIVAYLGSGHDIRDLINVGPQFITAGQTSSVINHDPSYRETSPRDHSDAAVGYDGQFYYYIALDPTRARSYIDAPSYRYQRILYPMLARFTALEQPAAMPWTLLIINWLACGGGVLALAAWLRRRGSSPWLAAIYGLYPGMLVAIQFDLTEPLAYALVALGVYWFDFGGRRGVVASAVAFGLAGLARETTLLFPILYGLSILAGRPSANPHRQLANRVRQALGFMAIAGLPFVAWIIVDYSWLGVPHPDTLGVVPLGGLFAARLSLPLMSVELISVALPALLFSAVALSGLGASTGRLERLCLLANTAMMVVFSTGVVWNAYASISRQGIAIVLAALLCVPYLSGRSVRATVSAPAPQVRLAVTAAAVLCLVMLPGALYGGFARVSAIPRRAIATHPHIARDG